MSTTHALGGRCPPPVIANGCVLFLTWTDGECSDQVSRGAIPLRHIDAYYTLHESDKAPSIVFLLRGGSALRLDIEEPDDAWQAFIDFTERLDKELWPALTVAI